MDMKKLEFLDIYPDPISGSEKGYISISYIQHLDIYPGYISNGYISYPFLFARFFWSVFILLCIILPFLLWEEVMATCETPLIRIKSAIRHEQCVSIAFELHSSS